MSVDGKGYEEAINEQKTKMSARRSSKGLGLLPIVVRKDVYTYCSDWQC
jgi:hypothetical protein